MKKKIYLIVYAIAQLIVSVYYGIFAETLAVEQVETVTEAFKTYPENIQKMISQMYTVDSMHSSLILTAIVGGILALILLWIFVKDKVGVKKGLALGLTIASLVLFGGGIVLVLSAIAIYLIATTKKEQVTGEAGEAKEKNKIQKLRPLKVDTKDILLAVVLIVLYASQFFLPPLMTSLTMSIIVLVIYYVGVFAFCIYVFNKRLKRDFKAYKQNVGKYVGYSFKWWGIMMLFSMVAAILRMVFGGDVVTANQTGLNEAPLWYVVPLSILWAPFVEELIFRGCIRRFIKNDVVFVIVSALAFGLIHTITSEVGLYNMIIQSLQYMAMGGVMAFVYTRTNNIGTNMTIHLIQNTLATVLLLFA